MTDDNLKLSFILSVRAHAHCAQPQACRVTLPKMRTSLQIVSSDKCPKSSFHQQNIGFPPIRTQPTEAVGASCQCSIKCQTDNKGFFNKKNVKRARGNVQNAFTLNRSQTVWSCNLHRLKLNIALKFAFCSYCVHSFD